MKRENEDREQREVIEKAGKRRDSEFGAITLDRDDWRLKAEAAQEENSELKSTQTEILHKFADSQTEVFDLKEECARWERQVEAKAFDF